MLSTAKTEFAHPTPVPGTESWIDELRMLTKRRYDHRGDREEGLLRKVLSTPVEEGLLKKVLSTPVEGGKNPAVTT